jgi:hypothetical protein
VYADVIDYEPTLIQSCDSGKAGTLYSIIPSLSLLNRYSGAAAAYSLRSLSSSTINVVKVRRSGDDAELDFTASEVSDGTLAAWVVAGGGTEDGFVTTWYDQSGNGNNATQATAANQPKIVSSGSLVTENGKAAIDFDPLSLQYISSTITSPSNNVCFVGVCYTTSLSGARGFMEIFDVANDGYELRYDGTTSEANFAINSTDLLVTSTNQFLWFANYDGSTQLNSINGSGDTQSAVESISVSSTTLKIGARLPASGNSGYYWDGKIQEAIFYPSDQSANRTGIEANINDYYNIYP